jgi:hypothetical protein
MRQAVELLAMVASAPEPGKRRSPIKLLYIHAPNTADSGNKACFGEAIWARFPAKGVDHDQLAEPPQIPSRDFLPWRFSDADSHPVPNNTRASGV